VASITDLPVLASIPRANKKQQETLPLAVYRDPEGHFAQGFHKVRSAIEFAGIDSDLKTILVTSPNAGEGKSTTSSNLALALSTVGSRTVLVDVDFRRARLHKIYRIAQTPGLSDTVLNGTQMTSVSYGLGDPGLDNLLVVPTGTIPPSPAAFVGTSGFNKAVKWIRDNADVVILDAPPLFAVSDGHTMARNVDAVVLAVMAGETTKSELAEVISNLRQVGANLLGVVLTGVEASEGYGRYYYYRNDEEDALAAPSHDDSDLWSRQAAGNMIELGDLNGNGVQAQPVTNGGGATVFDTGPR
jgi:capsular exopolysaccharide synthesis family protein